MASSLDKYGERCCETFALSLAQIKLSRVQRPDKAQLVDKSCDLWAYVWSCSAVAADIACHVQAFLWGEESRPTFVELGCGSGLCSVAAATHHASQRQSEGNNINGPIVIATDLVPAALELVETNAALNGVQRGVLATAKLDWSNSSDLEAVAAMARGATLSSNSIIAASSAGAEIASQPRPLIVMGADVLFSSWTVKPLLRVVATLLAADCTRPGLAIIVDPGRPPRDDLEGALDDALITALGLAVVKRVDVQRLVTPLGLMRECTVFGLAAKSQATTAAAAGDAADGLMARAFDYAMSRTMLREGACLSEEEARGDGSGRPQYTFCLPPVK